MLIQNAAERKATGVKNYDSIGKYLEIQTSQNSEISASRLRLKIAVSKRKVSL